MSNIKDKILYFIENQRINKTDFFKNLELSYSNFKGVQKKSALSSDAVAKILAAYPNLSADWLLSDVGEMLKTNSDEQVEHNTNETAGIRLAEYAEQKNLSIKDFGIKCDIGYNNTASLLKGSLPLGMQVLHKIKKAFPYINTEWVLFGNGEMEINNSPINSINNKDIERLEQTNNLLLGALKDKDKTITSLENQIELLQELKELKSQDESPIKSNVGK